MRIINTAADQAIPFILPPPPPPPCIAPRIFRTPHWSLGSLIPRPLPDFILQPWKKIGRRPGIKTTSWARSGGVS